MREFRQNPITGQWVIISTERANRPHNSTSTPTGYVDAQPDADRGCPFCSGRERQTPPEVFAVRDDHGTVDQAGWRVRVIPNKFPALTIDAEGVPTPESVAFNTWEPHARAGADSWMVSRPGIGFHEVVIESPDHAASFTSLEPVQAALVVQALRHRSTMMMQARDVKQVCIFKNHGARAGSTIAHPHFQIIAPSVVPPQAETMLERQEAYAKRTGRLLFGVLLDDELAAGDRVVTTNDEFVSLAPWAAQSPQETWIVPREHSPLFGELPDGHVALFASIVQDTLQRIDIALNRPDYNLVIHSAPKGQRGREHHRWFVQVTPRLTIPAGFEHGTGMFINHLPPEEAAAALRDAKPIPVR